MNYEAAERKHINDMNYMPARGYCQIDGCTREVWSGSQSYTKRCAQHDLPVLKSELARMLDGALEFADAEDISMIREEIAQCEVEFYA